MFSLGGWSPQLPTGLPDAPVVLGIAPKPTPCLRLRDCYPLWWSLPAPLGSASARPGGSAVPLRAPHNPPCATAAALTRSAFGLVPVRSPLLRESRLISFPPGTEMFQFPGLLGHSGIDARWAAPPDLSQPSTPVLMTPRHPPRALRSLTTPIGPPPRNLRREPGDRCATPQSGGLPEDRSSAASRDAAPGASSAHDSIRKGSRPARATSRRAAG